MEDERPLPGEHPGERSVRVLAIRLEEIDVANAPAFLASLLGGEDLSSPVVVDLERVTFMDTTGLTCLMEAARCRRACGGDVVLAACTRAVRRILRVTGADSSLNVYPSVAQARRGLGAGET